MVSGRHSPIGRTFYPTVGGNDDVESFKLAVVTERDDHLPFIFNDEKLRQAVLQGGPAGLAARRRS